MTEVIIRFGKREDLEAITEFQKNMALETEDKQLDPDTVHKGVQAVFDDKEKGTYIIAESNGAVIGSALITLEWSDWRNGFFWWIQSVYVDPQYRRKGVFSELYSFIEAKAQNDPDVLMLREFHTHLSDEEVRSLALWQGVLGGVVNTSTPLHEISPDRQHLWRFVVPQGARWTAVMPYWGQSRNLQVAVRAFELDQTWAVLVLNSTDVLQREEMLLSDLVGMSRATVYEWLPSYVKRLGRLSVLAPDLQRHASVLYYVSAQDAAPPPSLTLGGVSSCDSR